MAKRLFVRTTFFGDAQERYNAGTVATIDDDKYAERLISSGYAQEISEEQAAAEGQSGTIPTLREAQADYSMAVVQMQPAPGIAPAYLPAATETRIEVPQEPGMDKQTKEQSDRAAWHTANQAKLDQEQRARAGMVHVVEPTDEDRQAAKEKKEQEQKQHEQQQQQQQQQDEQKKTAQSE